MSDLNVGVIGVGLMGRMHANVYNNLSNTNLVAVADPDNDRRNSVARDLGVEEQFDDYGKMLEMDSIDAVSICTPDEMHKEPVTAASRAGKDIFLEKPLATNLGEAKEILHSVDENDVKLMVGYLLRFDPRYAQVKESIDKGELGDLLYIISHRSSPQTEGPARYKPGTSLTMHVAVHDLDLIYWYMDSNPSEIFATGTDNLLSDRDMMDAATALLSFENGSFASVNYSWALPDKSPTKLDARMEIVGTEGSAYIGVPHQQGVLMATESGISTPDLHHNPKVRGKVVGDLREEIIAFVNSALSGENPPISGRDAFASLAQAHAIMESLHDNEPVKFDSPKL